MVSFDTALERDGAAPGRRVHTRRGACAYRGADNGSRAAEANHRRRGEPVGSAGRVTRGFPSGIARAGCQACRFAVSRGGGIAGAIAKRGCCDCTAGGRQSERRLP